MPVTSACSIKPRCETKPRALVDYINRREWVKCFALGWAASLTGAARSTLLADISPSASPSNILKFDLLEFPTLQIPFGSMRFNLFGTSFAGGIITITRAAGNVFHAVSAFCTHAGCIVDPYDNTPETQAMICYCHSSVYDIQGQVIYGVDVGQANLPYYYTELDGSILSVEIPNLNFKLNGISPSAPVGGNSRFKLSFPVKINGKYRILYTPDLATAPSPVKFSISAGGAVSRTQFNSSANLANTDVWVENTAARGFYMVELIVSEYQP
jgi:nitrite reductase/ring-hydroxylating ferredoxin subunit